MYQRESTPWILERMPLTGCVLDVGGIRGECLQDLAERFLGRSYSLTEVDVADTSALHPLLTFIHNDILRTSLPLGWFVAATAIHVLQHIGRPWHGVMKIIDNNGDWKFTKALHRWLAPGGVAFIETTIADKEQILVWDEHTAWKIYTKDLLHEMFADFAWGDEMIYDGSLNSKSRVPDAQAIVFKVRKA